MMKIAKMEVEDLFSNLGEGCISHILSFTSPRDACRCSAVCRLFRSASESNVVWERFLPSDNPEILARSVSPVEFFSKKKLFFRLCDSILIDEGKMSFSMDKVTCRKGYMVSARELNITWGDHPLYWQWSSLPESRFGEVAELLGVCWLEIRGKIDSHILSPKTAYKAFLVFKISEEAYGLDCICAKTSIKLGSHEFNGTVSLQPVSSGQPVSSVHDVQAPEARSDGWMVVEMGEFFNDEGEDGEIEMALKKVGPDWMGGLIIEGIEIRPV